MNEVISFLDNVRIVFTEKTTLIYSLIASLFASLMGDHSVFIYWLLLFITVDYLTGFMASIVKKEVASKKMFVGLMKKTSIIFICVLFHGLGQLIGWDGMCAMAVSAFCINEMISVLENLDRAGMGDCIPAPLRNILESVKRNQEAQMQSRIPTIKKDEA